MSGTSTSRRSLVAVMAALLWLGLVSTAPGAVQAQEGETAVVERAQGANRFETAVAVSARTFADPSAVDVVHLSTGLEFADALAAGTAAAAQGGPVLLTAPDAVPPEVVAEIERLDPDRVVLVGGSQAVGNGVAAQIDHVAEVTRVGGADRFETAAELARGAFDRDDVDVVFVATGIAFADALGGVPVASLLDAPLLLATDSVLPQATIDAIDALAPERVVVLGGTSAIGRDVVRQLDDLVDGGVERLSGSDRFETAEAAVRTTFPGAREVFVARGGDFADALGGGAAAAFEQGALVLAPDDGLTPGTASLIRDLNPRRVTVLGGPGALSDSVVADVQAALEGVTSLPIDAIPDLLVSGWINEGEAQSLHAATLDGRHEIIAPAPPGTADVSAAWSPDGSHLTFQRINAASSGRPTNPVPHVMDFVAGPSTIRPLADEGFCRGDDEDAASAIWRPSRAADAVLLECRQGTFERPDSATLTVQPLVGAGQPVTPPDGLTYMMGQWAPDGRLSVLARDDDDALGVYMLEDDAWDGGVPELVTDRVDGVRHRWVDTADGPMLVHRDIVGDDQVLLVTSGTQTSTLFEGDLDGAPGEAWHIGDATSTHLLLATSHPSSSGASVIDMVGLDGDVTRIIGHGDYAGNRDRAGARFLPDGETILVTESVFVRQSGAGFDVIREGIVTLRDAGSGARSRLFADFGFALADAVNPVGSR